MKNKVTCWFLAYFLVVLLVPIISEAGSRTDQINIMTNAGATSITGRVVRLSINTSGTSSAVASYTGIIIRGAVNQGAPYLDIQNHTGLSYLSVSSLGVLGMPGTVAGTINGDFWFDTGQQKHATYSNGMVGYGERCIWSAYTRTCTSGIVTGMSILTSTTYRLGSTILPANFWRVGKALRVRMQGYYSTDASPGNGNLTVKFSNYTYATTGDFSLDVSENQSFWALEFAVACQATGISGRLDGALGWQHTVTTGGTHSMNLQPMPRPDPLVLDTTTAQTFDVSWSATDTGTTLCLLTGRIWEAD